MLSGRARPGLVNPLPRRNTAVMFHPQRVRRRQRLAAAAAAVAAVTGLAQSGDTAGPTAPAQP